MVKLSFQMSVEVERKFVCEAGMQKKLEAIGAVCIGQHEFHDQYFDTADFDLTLRDVWLRRRKESWELKCPTVVGKAEDTSGEQPNEASLCSRYKEITSLPEIKLTVKEVLKHSPGSINTERCQRPEKVTTDDGKTAAQVGLQDHCGPERITPKEHDYWTSELGLVCFAEFTTVRCSFSLEEDGVRIDLDEADFGYSVGEIEMLVQEGQDVGTALEKIERTARKLSLTGNQRVEGKMDVYLRRYCPEHYAKLLSVHVL